MTPDRAPDLRLAFRVEGDYWVAFAAPADSMADAVVLGAIAMTAVLDPARKRRFLDLMRDSMGAMLRGMLDEGAEVTWGDPMPGPDHERS